VNAGIIIAEERSDLSGKVACPVIGTDTDYAVSPEGEISVTRDLEG
jgi:hypothetical protein